MNLKTDSHNNLAKHKEKDNNYNENCNNKQLNQKKRGFNFKDKKNNYKKKCNKGYYNKKESLNRDHFCKKGNNSKENWISK